MSSIEEQYARALAQFRREKDKYLREDPDSPIPEEERATFKGLRYYPPLFPLRVAATVERLPERAIVTIATSDGASREFLRYALLHFTIDGQELLLTGYRDAEDDPENQQIFIPFREALSGKETYGAGRYLDVTEDAGPDGAPIAILDFNLAYNPYCAYNENYSCPLTPPENTLPIPIQAGERVYHTE
jgi:uncharacterized protein